MGMTIIDAEESMIPQLAALEEQCFSIRRAARGQLLVPLPRRAV